MKRRNHLKSRGTGLPRLVALLLALALVVAACGSDDGGSTDTTAPGDTPVTTDDGGTTEDTMAPVTLNVLHNWGADSAKGPVLQSVFEGFMAEHPNITVTDEILTDLEIPTKVETAFIGGEEPDIVFSNRFPQTQLWVQDGIAIDVRPLLEEWSFESPFVDQGLESMTDADGALLAFPLEGFTWPVWYNTAILDEAGVGVPQSIDEMLAAIPAIRDAGFEPFVAAGADWPGAQLFELIMSTQMTNEEIRSVYQSGDFLGSANAVKGAELFVELRDAGLFSDISRGSDFGSMNESFFAGEAAMMHGGSWSFADSPPDLADEIALGGFPIAGDSPRSQPVMYGGFEAKGVWITRNGSEKLDAVESFVEYLFRPSVIAQFVEDSAMVPSIADVPVDESALNPLFNESLQLDTEVAQLPDNYMPASVYDARFAALQIAFDPSASAQDILTALSDLYG